MRAGTIPVEVTTDRAPVYPRVLDELMPSALHVAEQYANNPVEADHGLLKARLRPMRGLKRHRSARILAAGHAFIQNLRRGHYEIAADVPARHTTQQCRCGHLRERGWLVEPKLEKDSRAGGFWTGGAFPIPYGPITSRTEFRGTASDAAGPQPSTSRGAGVL
jgi:DDE domain